MAETELQRGRPSGGSAETPQDGDRPLDVLVGHELERAPALELVRLVAQDPQDGRALVADRPIDVEDRDDVERVLEEQAEEIVARLKPLGDLPELGHVLLHRDEVGDRPGVVGDRGHRLLLGVETAVLAAVDQASTPATSRPDGRPQLAVHTGLLHARLQDARGVPDGFRRREAGQASEGRVDGENDAVPVGDHDRVGRGVHRHDLKLQQIVGESFPDSHCSCRTQDLHNPCRVHLCGK